MSNPLDTAYSAVCDRLEAHGGLTALVKVGNRIRYDDANWKRRKTSTQSADHPELDVRQTTVQWGGWTSDSVECVQGIRFALASGDLRIDAKLNPVLFNLLAALEQMSELGGTVVAGGVVWRPVDFAVAMDEAEANRGTSQWTAIGAIQVKHYIPRSTLPT